MKRKIKLDAFKVESFVTESDALNTQTVKGGGFSQGDPCTTNEPEFCNWTYNAWCYSGNGCNTRDLWCTAPK
ncbi:MAG: pinensin family lanthipeptide [Cyclobacteriaceae bacterium]